MTRLAGIDIDAPPELVLPIFLAALLGLSIVAARLTSALTKRWLGRHGGASPTPAPKLGLPIGTVVLVGGVLLVLQEIPLPGRLGHWIDDALMIAFVLGCAAGLSRLAVAAIVEYSRRNPSFTPALGVARGTARVAIVALALVTALETLGVPVAPLLTTLGIGSLAVALALQDTLANFFAGLHLLADRPVSAGDYIKLHDGEEGYVDTIGWRSSRLRTLKGTVVIVPNQKLSQTILTNYHRPTSAVMMTIAISIQHRESVADLEAIFADELARAAAALPELRDAKPVARLVELTDSGQLWNCVVEVPNFEAQGIVGHELRKRLVERLGRENVALGVPERLIKSERKTAK